MNSPPGMLGRSAAVLLSCGLVAGCPHGNDAPAGPEATAVVPDSTARPRKGIRDETAVTRDLAAALARVPGVTAVEARFAALPKGSGAVHGTVSVTNADAFAEALRAVAIVLGPDGGRVTVYMTGRTPDGGIVEPDDLGMFARPNGPHILKWFEEKGRQ